MSPTGTNKFTLAMGQMRVVGGDLAGNLARAVAVIERAMIDGADLVVLPEVLDCGWCDDSGREHAQPVDPVHGGETLETLCRVTAASQIHVCAGLTERDLSSEAAAKGDRETIYNAAVLIDPTGFVVLKHRKVHQLDIEKPFYAAGTTAEAVCDTDLGRLGVATCADAFAKGEWITRSLADRGAQVIVSPCAWAVPPNHDQKREPYGDLWRDVYGRVAKERGLWIAGVSNVGTIRHGGWAGHHCIGCSMLVGPDGDVQSMGPYGEDAQEIVYATVTLPEP